MAWPTVQIAAGTSADLGDGNGGSISWTHTTVSGDTKICALVGSGVSDASSHITSVTFNSNTLTRIANIYDDNFERSEIWELNSPDIGAFTLQVNFATTAIQIFGCSISLSGAAVTTGTPSTNTGTSANPSVTVVDSASGDVVIAVVSNDEGGAIAVAGGALLIGEAEAVGSDSTFSGQYQSASGASTVCSWTEGATGAGWAAVGIAISQAGAGGGQAPRSMHLNNLMRA